jgi:hypothetical protein
LRLGNSGNLYQYFTDDESTMTSKLRAFGLLNTLFVPGEISRLALAVMVMVSVAACAVAPTGTSAPGSADYEVPGAGMAAAIDDYNKDDYPAAISGFDAVIADTGTSANDRRLAYLGKTLVYLGSDENLHSIENARQSLASAGQVAGADSKAFTVESELLMEALSTMVGMESRYVALLAISGDPSSEVEELERERDALAKERDELLAEREALNEALERLKQLTLGN